MKVSFCDPVQSLQKRKGNKKIFSNQKTREKEEKKKDRKKEYDLIIF